MNDSTTQHGNMIRLYEEVLPVAWTRCNAEFIYFYCNLKFKKTGCLNALWLRNY